MKKLSLSLVISFVLTLIGTGINYLGFQNDRWLPLSIKMYGGEFMGQLGFGWIYRHIYSMRADESDTVSLSFSILCFLATWLLIFLIVYMIMWIIKLIRNKT